MLKKLLKYDLQNINKDIAITKKLINNVINDANVFEKYNVFLLAGSV